MFPFNTPNQYLTGTPRLQSQEKEKTYILERNISLFIDDMTISRNISLFIDDMTISLDKSQEIYRKKLLKVINEFSKNAGYKVNIQKSIILAMINWKPKFLKMIIYNRTKKLKCLGIHICRIYMLKTTKHS